MSLLDPLHYSWSMEDPDLELRGEGTGGGGGGVVLACSRPMSVWTIEKVGGRRAESGRERRGDFPFNSRIPLAADPTCRLRAFSIILTEREPGTG